MTLHDALIEIARKEGVPGTAEHFATVMVPYFEAFGREVHQRSRDDSGGYFDVAGAEDGAISAGVRVLKALTGD